MRPKAEHTPMTRQIAALINGLTSIEQIQAIYDAAAGRATQIQAATLGDFKLGDEVSFVIERGRNAGEWIGTITGFKGTAAKLSAHRRYDHTGRNLEWTVGATLLRPITVSA